MKSRIRTGIITAFLLAGSCNHTEENNYTAYVDPFIGTASTGHTFPGAAMPFGMVQLSPDLSTDRWEFCSGYNSQLNSLIGFSHTHLNGTGIGDLGDILVMPMSGNLTFIKGSESMPETGYRSIIGEGTETASAGYYSAQLVKYNIFAELTASLHSGFHRYTFNDPDSMILIIDLESNISYHDIPESELTLVNDTLLTGHKVVRGWPGRRDIFFAMCFSEPITSFILKKDWKENIVPPKELIVSKNDKIKVDGIPGKKEWKLDQAINRIVTGESDNRADFGVCWDERYLYFGIKVSDNKVIMDSDFPWDDDAVEIYIDGNNNRTGGLDEYDHHFGITADGKNAMESGRKVYEINRECRISEDGYTMEIALEWEQLGLEPVPGLKIGMDISIDDEDDSGAREGQMIWSGDDNNWLSTEYYGEIVLADEKGMVPEEAPSEKANSDQVDTAIKGFPVNIKEQDGIISAVGFGKAGRTELLVKVGISTTGTEAALQNLSAEIPGWDFDAARENADEAWNRKLSSIRIKADEKLSKIFYTSLYHSCLQPNLISDTDGSYRAPDQSIRKDENGKFYSTFSLWDTYRAWNPLMTIIDTSLVKDMLNSLKAGFDFYGILPRWVLWGAETHTMIGNHAIPVIIDAYFKGIGNLDPEEAYQMVKTSSMKKNPLSNFSLYNQYGYLPCDMEKTESVSKTLEMAFDDWCVAQMAKSLGKEEDYLYFNERSGFYRNLFDPDTRFMRGKDSKGNWSPEFDPLEASHASLGNGFYTEGNAWQHAWYVPQDMESLVDLMGGKEAFSEKLDSLFSLDVAVGGALVNDVSGLIGQYAHGNEPSHHVAYLYNYAGQAWKTQAMVRKIMNEYYSDERDGLCGNDDCGQMSAWYIMSAMGFYPVNPASGIYNIGSPCIDEAVIAVRNGNEFIIRVIDQSPENIYVKSLSFNGRKLEKPFITHKEIMDGGELIFVMDSNPNKDLF